jgi:hypothetical protein
LTCGQRSWSPLAREILSALIIIAAIALILSVEISR